MGFNYSSKLYGAGGATIGDNGFVYNPVTDTLTVGTLNANNVTATALATPGAITVTNQGAPGGTTVTYKLVALLADGTTTEAGAASSTATSNATLSATNFNRLAWSAVTGATSYRVYRTVAPTTPNTTGIIYSGTALTVDDTGLAGGGETAPTTNGTGVVTLETLQTTGTAAPEFLNVFATNASAQTANRYGMRSFYVIENGNTGHAYANGGVLGEVFVSSTNSQSYTSRFHGLYGYVHHRGSGTLSDARGTYNVTGVFGAGNITDAYGNYNEIVQETGATGHVTNAYIHYAAPFINRAGSTAPTNIFGYYAAAQDGLGTNVWAFYSAGSAKSQFGGEVSAGFFTTPSTISSTGTTDTTGVGTGILQIAGGAAIAKKLFVGTNLLFPATGTTGAIGIDFGSGELLYRKGAGTIGIDGANLNIQGDVLPRTTSAQDLGSSSLKWRQIFTNYLTVTAAAATVTAPLVAPSLRLATGARPTCDATTRGTFWYVAGGAGVGDTCEICRKDAADAYAWVSLF